MSEVILLDRHGDGAANAYYKGQCWKRVPAEERDGSSRWINDSIPLEPVESETQRVLENAYQDPRTPSPTRHPRLVWERKPGQPVYSPGFGFGKIVAIQDNKIVVKFGKNERVMRREELVTRAEAENDWHFYWLTGERRRQEEGRRLSIVKNLCEHEHGAWQKFLRKYDYPRSTAGDLIRRYNNEIKSAARNQMSGNRSIETSDPGRHMNKYAEDPEGRERSELIKAEAEKRHGKVPTDHKTRWLIGIELPPNVVVVCRKKYKRRGKRGKKFWRLAAYLFAGINPSHEKHHQKFNLHPESK